MAIIGNDKLGVGNINEGFVGPIKPLKAEGTINEVSREGTSVSYRWMPKSLNESGHGVAPVFSIYPNIGYHFMGFEVDKEVKESDNNMTHTFSVLDKADLAPEIAGGGLSVLGIATQDKSKSNTVDWRHDLLKYTAYFNKNIYNVYADCRFFDEQGQFLKSVNDISTIHIGIQDPNRSESTIFTKLDSVNPKGGNFVINRINKSNPLNTFLSAKKISFNDRDLTDSKVLVSFDTTNTRKSDNFVLGDSFKLMTKKTNWNTKRYNFTGWYLWKAGDPADRLTPLKYDDGRSVNKGTEVNTDTGVGSITPDLDATTTYTTDTITINKEFIKANPIIAKYNDAQIYIIAKWSQGIQNIEIITPNPEGGMVGVGTQYYEPIKEG